ncbi:MAG TPA: hypothetical protein VJS92_06340 [Candidatus Polarisedimenticolaceae bacterium]|nr:hypothetical protein [Candidatus Polarisedimenticolaceae bacterium]
MSPSRGASLLELLAVLALAGMAAAVAVPALAHLRSAGRVAAGARLLAIELHAARWKSVTRRVHHGLFFERDGRGWRWREVRDGNGNGVRTAEVRSGVDPTLGGPYRLEQRIEGVRLGFPAVSALPAIPPGTGRLANLTDPIQFGSSDVVSFSPAGASSSGTLYLTDGQTLYAVVLFGPTTRVRVWRYDAAGRRWKL